ncbi:MAG: hypothetical protein GC129_01570 [Proteobacteria bacterium]|nr:hypothetical protein [Pseudomonadota bacterium]
MTRSSYRNIMLVTLAALMALSAFIFFSGQSIEEEILTRQNQLTRLNQELDNAARLSAALTELDQLTIDEQTATQLDILRHLGLEQTDINFTVDSREVRTVGENNLYVRNVSIEGDLDYSTALYLADRLHNTKKIVINLIQLTPSYGQKNKVHMRLTGKIYGLDKKSPGQPS